MNNLLSLLRTQSFEKLLCAYKKEKIDLGHFIDGGAGFGSTVREMMPFLGDHKKIYAFEPFFGNARFFDQFHDTDSVVFIPKAMSDQNCFSNFYVPSTVKKDTEWGSRGFEGYSSVGKLVGNTSTNENQFKVQCVRCDDELSDVGRVGFIKLDLQGGELAALRGMPKILRECSFLWVEFEATNMDLYRFLLDQDFLMFDTDYLFIGDPSDEALEIFHLTSREILSTGQTSWSGFKKKPWYCFAEEMPFAKEKFGLIQTDLVCINKRRIGEFLSAARHLDATDVT